MSLELHRTIKGTTRVPEISQLQAGNQAIQMEKEKTMSISKHVDDHIITGIALVSIRKPN